MTHQVDAREDDLTESAMWTCSDCPAGAVGFETLDDAYTDALAHADGAE